LTTGAAAIIMAGRRYGTVMFSYDTIREMNETELGIYTYITANLDKIPFMTIRELSGAVHVSTSTVLRFCNTAGFEKYAEFKEAVQSEKEGIMNTPPQEDLKEILQYMTGTNTSAFEEKIESAAALIRKADTVIFAGQGSSGTLAKYGARYFTNLGKFSVGLEDTFYPVGNNFPHGGALVVLSESGETKEVNNFVLQFRKKDFSILSITNSPHSTLAKLSDWNISYMMNHERINGGFNATTQVPVLFIMETIARRIDPCGGFVDKKNTL
jgi:DNA-binding MurR/RpiR family transcriptional regulator